MTWAQIIAILEVVSGIIKLLDDQKLLEAGQAQILAAGLQATMDNLAQAAAAAAEVTNNPTGDYATDIQNKYTRPDGE